jgi:outer membrane cobalamin receptor
MTAKYWIIIDSDGKELSRVWDAEGVTPSDYDSKTWIETDNIEDLLGKQYNGTEWVTTVDTRDYTEKRKEEYDSLNQFEMQFDDQRDGTTTWVDAINAIKAKFPK